MKKLEIAALAMGAVIFFTFTPAFADETPEMFPTKLAPEFTRLDAACDLGMKTGGFLLGVAAGWGFHEGSHQLAAWAQGSEMRWGKLSSGMEWRTNAPTKSSKIRTIALAGFAGQMVSTEMILGVDAIPKDNAFVLGWMTFNILNSVAYVIDYEMDKDQHGSDLATLRRAGNVNMPLVEGVLVAHAALSAYRLITHKDLPIFVGTTGKDVTVLWTGRF